MRRADGSHDCLPLEALIRGAGESDTLCVAHEGFSLRLTILYPDSCTALIRACSERAYDRPGDTAQLNLPLVLRAGTVLARDGGSFTLDETPRSLNGPGRLAYGGWKLSMPEGSSFVWPYYTYNPYGEIRVPKNISAAVGVLSLPLVEDKRWVEIRIETD